MKIAAIVITFEPNLDKISSLIESLKNQVYSIYVIDNSESNQSLEQFLNPHEVIFHSMRGNTGIAKALNFGINTAFKDEFEDVVIFDQDSIPDRDMVIKLLQTRKEAELEQPLIAAVGPQSYDREYSLYYNFVIAHTYNVSMIKRIEHKAYCKPSFLISSGSLINHRAWKDIGEMDDDFFIDCVDIEWGFRAKSKGYQCIGAFNAILYHKLGDAKLKLFGIQLTNHAPIRHYYYFRNFYRLLQRRYVPLSWKIHVFIKSTIQAFIFSFLNKDGAQHAKMILTGILHGLRNKGGAYDSK